jgi:hypothetical protein
MFAIKFSMRLVLIKYHQLIYLYMLNNIDYHKTLKEVPMTDIFFFVVSERLNNVILNGKALACITRNNLYLPLYVTILSKK